MLRQKTAPFALLLLVLVALPARADDAVALAESAAAHTARGAYDDAVDAYRAALAIDPSLAGARFQLARVLAFLGRFEEARAEFAAIVDLHPQDGLARRGEVTALLVLDRWAEARRELEEGLRAMPREGQLAYLLARVLATAPDAAVRDGRVALALARSVYDAVRSLEAGEAIAMAHAELGEFDRAVAVQTLLVERAEKEGDEAARERLAERLAAYQEGRPWRAENGREIALSIAPPGAERPAGG